MATQEEMLMFYENNKDFERYVNECMKTYCKDLESMLQTRIVESYYEYLKEEMENKKNEN